MSLPDRPDDTDAAFQQALERLLLPLARLCLDRGHGFPVLAEAMKRALVAAAREVHSGAQASRDVSRVATTTGLTRREVTRITNTPAAEAAPRSSPATQVFTRWMGSRRLQDKDGRPKALPRQGKAPSFEELARSVTRDVHPRSLLEELCRLGLVSFDPVSDTVTLQQDSFVPSADLSRLLGFVGSNVGDHLSAAVANLAAGGAGEKPPHFEQAVFADGLSAASAARLRGLVTEQWRALMAALVPELEAMIEVDGRDPAAQPLRRVRIGLYTFHAEAPAAAPSSPHEPDPS